MESKILCRVTGAIAIVTSLSVTVCFILLGKIFGYPEIIREAPEIILTRLYEHRGSVPYLYYVGVGLGGISIIYMTVLLRKILDPANKGIFAHLGQLSGFAAGLLLYIGVLRYSILFPYLAELRINRTYEPGMIDLVFDSFNMYVGVSIAEHAQFLFTGLMFVFFGISFIQSKIISSWIGLFGFGSAIVIAYGSLEPFDFPKAFVFNRIGSELIGIWFLLIGTNLVINSIRRTKDN